MERIGIIGTADIADRRFLPALQMSDKFEYVGVAGREEKKTDEFVSRHGGRAFYGYETIVNTDIADSLYLPLPPALHHRWGKECLSAGINVFMEKPFATNYQDTDELVALARKKEKVLFENYMFLYHRQLAVIKKALFEDRLLGELRVVRINFAFPHRDRNDFRYNRELGGGALLDCGGYTARLAMELLGEKIEVKAAKLNQPDGYDVDLYGSATLENSQGLVAQLVFGMDNGYKCELEVIGQYGWLKADRIFTAPSDFDVEIKMSVNNEGQSILVGKNNQFLNAIHYYYELLSDGVKREKMYSDILNISKLVEEIRMKG